MTATQALALARALKLSQAELLKRARISRERFWYWQFMHPHDRMSPNVVESLMRVFVRVAKGKA
jgi:hypothetical protein